MPRTNAATPAVEPFENVDAVMRLENKALHGRSTAERIADRVATVAGSTPFLTFTSCGSADDIRQHRGVWRHHRI